MNVRAGRTSMLASAGAAYAVMVVLAWTVSMIGDRAGDPPLGFDAPAWLRPWLRYDSGWYLYIAHNGYFYTPGQQSPVAFFPTYPLLMRGLGAFLGPAVAGWLLTIAAGATATLLFALWCRDRSRPAVTVVAVAVLLLYPYSLYLYGAVYADAVFLACALAAFLLLERGHPALAGLVGILATAGRPVGVAVTAGLLVRAVELAWRRRHGEEPLTDAWRAVRELPVRDWLVLVSGAGLAAYLAYQWIAFGTPFAFVLTESASGWDQGSGPEVWFKVAFLATLSGGGPASIARLLLPALLCLGTLLLLPVIRGRLGWGYAVYTAIVVAIPVIGTKDFMGSGRYLLVAFPAFAAVAALLVDRWPRPVRMVALPVSALLLGVALFAFGYGFEVS